MGQLAAAIKATLSLGGTGAPWVASRANDPVYVDLADYVHGRKSNKVTEDKALGYIPFFAAVRAISEDLARLPLKVYRYVDGGRQEERDHPVTKLLHRQANPYMTAFTFRNTLQAHVLTWGNGYAEIEYNDDGSIRWLWPLRPDRVEVLVDRQQRVYYRFTDHDGNKIDLPWRNVFHVHGLGSDGLKGYSVISIASQTLRLAVRTGEYGQDWFDRGGVPPAVLTYPKTLSDTARKNLRESIDNGTLTDRQRMALLEEGLDIKVLGIPPKDAQFLETKVETRDLMPTLFRMPPVLLSFVERSTSWGTGIEEQGIGYKELTLGSWMENWEQEGNMRLLTDEDRYLKHRADGFLRGRSRDRWANYKDGMDRGVYSIDDVRAMEDLNPLPEGMGERRFVPLNMAPLDQVGEMSMRERIEALGALARAGFDATDAAAELDLPAIDHTGLEPVTVSEQGDYARNGNGSR